MKPMTPHGYMQASVEILGEKLGEDAAWEWDDLAVGCWWCEGDGEEGEEGVHRGGARALCAMPDAAADLRCPRRRNMIFF